jgi:hypothetical protein
MLAACAMVVAAIAEIAVMATALIFLFIHTSLYLWYEN